MTDPVARPTPSVNFDGSCPPGDERVFIQFGWRELPTIRLPLVKGTAEPFSCSLSRLSRPQSSLFLQATRLGKFRVGDCDQVEFGYSGEVIGVASE